MSRTKTGPATWTSEPPSRARAHGYSAAYSEVGYVLGTDEVDTVPPDERKLLPKRTARKAAQA